MFPAPAFPSLPTERVDHLLAYYGYPITSRERAHAGLRGPAPGPANFGTTPSLPPVSEGFTYALAPIGVRVGEGQGASTRTGRRTSETPARVIRGESSTNGGPGPTSLASQSARRSAIERGRRRAVLGLRPAGAALAIEAADLSDEEAELEEEKAHINHFGNRFLLPYGRRTTQGELDAAPSPTPSDHDHRQEDRNGADVSPVQALTPGDEDEGDEVDLDASIEDRDADPDRSTEYDSDDLRLMRNMDRSIGSRTPGSEDAYDSGEDMDEE